MPANGRVFSVEYLPGQYDQRADSAVQCIQFLKADENPIIKTAVTYLITGEVSDDEFEKIKAYCINPVDSRETDMVKPDTLITEYDEPADVIVFDGFTGFTPIQNRLIQELLVWAKEVIVTLTMGADEDPFKLDGEQKKRARKIYC